MAERAGKSIAGFMALVLGCGVLIAATAVLTREQIETNHARRFLSTLTELTGSAAAAAEANWSGDVALLCPHQALLRGSASGYGGEIRWLAAADLSGRQPALQSLRIVRHQETPGIADFLDHPDQGWLASLKEADAAALARVDTVSGATITSRALGRSLATALTNPDLRAPECRR
jgi:Na+-translocating ferredoxin:NAD+ oxidoreductase RnfG subunit